MAVADELKIILRAETAKAVRDLRNAQRQTDRTEGRFGKLVGTVGKSVAAWAAAAVSIRAFARTLKESVELAGIQEQAERGLEAALIATGDASRGAAESIISYASELQAVTTYGDEATISAAALFQQVSGLSAEMTRNALPALQDFASAMGMDLQQAASLVGRSIGSTTNALTRYGIQIDNSLEGSERFDAIMGQLDDKFGGFAEAVAATSSGSLTQLNSALGDLKEIGGAAILDFIEPAVSGTTQFAAALASAITNSRDLATALQTGSSTGLTLEQLNNQIASLRAEADEIEEGIRQEAVNMANIGVVLAEDMKSFEELPAQVRYDVMSSIGSDERLAAIRQQIAQLSQFLGDFADDADEANDSAGNLLETVANKGKGIAKEMERAFGGEDGPIPEMNEDLQAAVRQVNELNAAFAQAADDAAAQRLADQVSKIQERVNQVSTAFNAGMGAINAWSWAFDQALEDSISKIEEQLEAMNHRHEREQAFAEAAGASSEELAEMRARQAEEQKKAEEALEAKKRELAEKQFRRDKAINIANAIMNTAEAVTSALTAGPVIGPILAGVVGALGAAQVAGIAAQPMPAFEKGGSFVTSGPQAIMVGDGASPRERVTVEPLSGPYRGSAGGDNIVVNFSGVVSEDSAVELVRVIERAKARGAA